MIEKELGIKAGETTQDYKFTFEVVYCLGSCGLSPVATIDDKVIGRLVPEKMTQILRETEVSVRELSLHILDILENAVEAGASAIEVSIDEDPTADGMVIEIVDNGRGMKPESDDKVLDPFYSTRKTRHVGLGFPSSGRPPAVAKATFSSIPSRGREHDEGDVSPKPY